MQQHCLSHGLKQCFLVPGAQSRWKSFL